MTMTGETMEMNTAHISNNAMMMGGSDEKGLFVCWGPMLREIYAIMVFAQDEETLKWVWTPYKMYKNTKHKTEKRANKKLWGLRRQHVNIRFKLDVIWESVPLEEMEKQYYETTEEIAEAIGRRISVPTDRIVLGLGDPGHAGPILGGLDGPRADKLKQILEGVGEKGTKISVGVAPEALGRFRGEPPVGETEGTWGPQDVEHPDEIRHGGTEPE